MYTPEWPEMDKMPEEISRSLVENAPDRIWAVDYNYCLIYGNRYFQENYHTASGKFLQKGEHIFFTELPDDHVLKWKKYYNRSLYNGESFSAEIETWKKTPTAYIQYSFSPLNSVEGKTMGVLIIGRDITQQILREKEVEYSELKYKALVQQSAEMLFLHDMNGKILEVNEASVKETGYSKEELLRMTVYDVDPDARETIHKDNLWIPLQLGEKHTFESRHRRKNGSVYPVEVTMGKIVFSGENYILVTARNIQSRKQAEINLRESEALYHAMFERNYSVKYLLDPENGNIIDANEAASRFYGYPVDQLRHMNISQININPLNRITKEMGEAMIEKRNYFLFRHRLADGTIKDVEAYSTPIDISGKKLLQVIAHDITEKKQAEEALKINEQHLRALVNAIPDMIFIMNQEGVFIDYKSAKEDLYVPSEVFLKKNINEVLPSWLVELTMENIRSALSSGNVVKFEYQLPFAEGFSRHYECRMVPYSDTEVLAIVRNVTERIEFIQKLKDSEVNARAIMEATDDVFILLTREGIVVDSNEAHARRLNLTREELVGKNVFDFLTGEIGQKRRQMVQEAIDTGQVIHSEDFRAGFWNEISMYPIFINGVTTDRVAVFARDITLRKTVENRFRELAAQWQSTFDAVNDAIWLLDKDHHIIRSNKAAEELFGTPAGEIIGKKCWLVVHGTDGPIQDCPVNKSFQSQTRESLELQAGDKWFQVTADPVINPEGDFQACIHIVSDITDRKNAEAVLKNNFDLLRLAGKTARFGGWSVDVKTNMVTWSDQVAEIHDQPYGYSPPVEEGIHYYTPEYRDRITEVYTRCITEGIPYDEILQIMTAKNRILWVRAIGEPVYDKNRNITGAQGAFQDITEIKQNEAIQASMLHLTQFAENHSFDEMVEEVLNEAEKLTHSQIGFFHLVADDQENLILQNWSARTKAQFCTAEGKGNHYPVTEAGVWVDCLYTRKPLIHNDYHALPHKKGMPAGHPQVIREMVFPLIRNEKVVSVLGVGNKLTDYDEGDVNTVSHFITLIWDIYTRKMTEEALGRSEERFRKIFEESPVGMALVNRNFQFTRVNKALCDFIQYSEDEMLNKSFVQVTHPDSVDRDKAAVKKILSGELQVYQTEKRYIRKDGVVVWGEAHISALWNDDGTLRSFLAIVKDISRRKTDEEKIREINENLLELNATKDKLFSIIAHDLKSPFNAILGFSSILTQEARTLDIEEIENYASIINVSADQTYKLLENLLDWARMQQGKIVFNPKSLIPAQLVREVSELLEENARIKQIVIKNLIPETMMMKADEDMMKTIFRNLISNAIKFSHMGGIIELTAVSEDDRINFSVKDQGTGISAENIKKLFNIGTTFTMRGTNNEKGTGLGLLLCKDFMDKHGGEISVQSEPGTGSTFSISFPGKIHY